MSIAITAPDKYKFQDLVCIELFLRFENTPDLTMLVEFPGGEDANLEWTNNGNLIKTEVQVKGAENTVSLYEVAECLAHFPPYKYENCLLERVLSDNFRFALLVMSGRCDDAAANYVMPPNWSGEAHKDNKFKSGDANDLIGER